MKTLVAFAALAVAAGAQAQVITIDQAKALAGSVTPGDAPGLPVTISQPGSYRLSGNLTVADPSADAIHVTTDHVTLDLGGFTISGPGSCSGAGPTTIACTPAGLNSAGIDATDRRMTTVRNGSIRGFGSGVQAGFMADVRGLMVREMNYYGISAHVNSSIVDNNVWLARWDGISGSGLVRNNLVYLARTGIKTLGLAEGNRVLVASYGISRGSNGGFAAASGNVLTSVATPFYSVTQLAPNLCDGSPCP